VTPDTGSSIDRKGRSAVASRISLDLCSRSALYFAVCSLAMALGYSYMTALRPPKKVMGIRCTNPVADVGTVNDASKPACTFTLVNDSKVPVHVSGIQAECRCTTVTPSTFPQTIEVGESMIVSCTVKTKGLTGSFARRLIVRSDAAENSALKLTVQGVVQPISYTE
jgi:uncharacterized protein DUF1573